VALIDSYFEADWNDAGRVRHAPSRVIERRRIVSLVPSLTETLCAVGGQSRLVGCTAFCVHPNGLLKDPAVTVVGGTKTVLREKILALKPDLILMNLEENTQEDIDFFQSRVECYVDGTRTLEEGLDTILKLGALLGVREPAKALYNQGMEGIKSIEARVALLVKSGRPRPAIFYAIWRDPWMSINCDTFIHEMLTRSGARNVFANWSERYPVVSFNDILSAAPDIMWLASEPYGFQEKHRAEWLNLPGLPAAQTGRVECIDGEQVCWFGVRQIAGLEYTFRSLWKV